MTKQEIDFTIDKLIELKKSGHFRATWTTFDQSVQLMAAGEVVIQSMWSPAVAAVRVKQIPCVYAPGQHEGRQGRLSRLVQRHGPDEASERQEAGRRLRIHQLVHVRLAGRVRQPLRLLQPGAVDREEVHDADRMGPSGTKASRRPRRSRIRTAFRWRRPAPSATAARSSSASPTSRAGTR